MELCLLQQIRLLILYIKEVKEFVKKVLKQFRFYGVGSDLTYPQGMTTSNLISGLIFNQANLISIASLGIQTWPGVKFYLNDSPDPIIIGSSGIYELSLSDNYEITALKFDSQSINLINSDSNEAYLIVDIIYNVEG